MGVENGVAALVTREQYQMGVATGMFIPTLPRPIYGKKHSAELGELFIQKLKEKFVEELADRAIKDPEAFKLVTGMFLEQHIDEQKRPDNSDEYSKLISRMSNLLAGIT